MTRVYLWSVLVMCLLGGCLKLGQNEAPAIHYYSLEPAPTTVPQAKRTWPVTLGVRPLTAGTRYRDRMLYRPSNVEVRFYEYDRWVEPPAEMVNRLLTEMLQGSNLFQQVASADDVQPQAWILSGEVLRFDEVRTNTTRHADVSLALELRRARDERLLWSDILTATQPLPGNTPEVLAQAMSRAVQALGAQLIARLQDATL